MIDFFDTFEIELCSECFRVFVWYLKSTKMPLNAVGTDLIKKGESEKLSYFFFKMQVIMLFWNDWYFPQKQMLGMSHRTANESYEHVFGDFFGEQN